MCWVHDDTGFADCGVIISGGEPAGEGLLINPDLNVTGIHAGKFAAPKGKWK
jgi:hypothetical protein